jgi:multidrug efflux pump subunit AcrA (membrane-fusion protein)
MRTRRLRCGAIAGAIVGAVVLAGCGGSDKPTGPATPLPSYLARYPPSRVGVVYFIQWQRRGESVDGTLTIVAPPALHVTSRTQQLTGEIDGRRIKLEVGTDNPQQWDGERAGRRIVFHIELDDGSSQTLRFAPATLADFRRAVG